MTNDMQTQQHTATDTTSVNTHAATDEGATQGVAPSQEFEDLSQDKPKQPWLLYSLCVILALGIIIFCVSVFMLQKKSQETPQGGHDIVAIDTQTTQDAPVSQSQTSSTSAEPSDSSVSVGGETPAKVAYSQYEQAFKNPSAYLAKDDGSAFATYKYVMCDINKDAIVDIVLMGTDADPAHPTTYSASILISYGTPDGFRHPKKTFKLTQSDQENAYLSRNTKHETILYTRKKSGVCSSELYALFTEELKNVSKKTYEDGKGTGDFASDLWQPIAWEHAYNIDDLEPLASL